ncbi:MAG TPA: hypothetical protein VKQ72_15740 [Aggregatilineales bacterium]|nr:hypothetical protein [Aggregatilineales bacterium]
MTPEKPSILRENLLVIVIFLLMIAFLILTANGAAQFVYAGF